MVNFSRHESNDKAQTLKVNTHSKGIKKPKAQSSINVEAKNVDASSNHTIVSLKCTKSSIQLNKNSYSNTANQTSLTTDHFQPFSNFSLFPSSLQTLFQNSPNFSFADLKDTVYKLKVPTNTLSFRKKVEKFKLLSLSQETFVQNYLKDKYQNSLNPFLLRDYYGYLKSKIQLNSQIEAAFAKNTEHEGHLTKQCFWQNQILETYNKSYLCTPTTAFNESFLPEDVAENGAKEMKMKYEDCDKYFEGNDFEGNDRFKGDLEFKPIEQAKKCRDYHFDDYFHLKQENFENETAMKFMINDWQD
jgi:hypothetical protein